MTKKIELSFCTCTFTHDEKRQILIIDMIKKGKMIYQTQISKASRKFVNQLIKTFDDKEAKDIYSLQMEVI
jgi:hypothetical protein